MPSVQYSFDFNPGSIQVDYNTGSGQDINSSNPGPVVLLTYTTSSTEYAYVTEFRFISSSASVDFYPRNPFWIPPSTNVRIEYQSGVILLYIGGNAAQDVTYTGTHSGNRSFYTIATYSA